MELNSMRIDQYSLIERSAENSNCNRALKCAIAPYIDTNRTCSGEFKRALKCVVHSCSDRYSLIEQSLCSEIL